MTARDPVDSLERHYEDLKQAEALAIRDSERQELRDIAHARAMDILENGDPVTFILNTFEKQHKGDKETGEGLLVSTANQCVENSKGIQSSVHGDSGKGKSHGVLAMLHLFPTRCYMIACLGIAYPNRSN